MNENTFVKDITFLCQTFDPKSNKFEHLPVTKQATFKELSQTDPKQHKLFFLMFPLFVMQTTANGEERIVADPEILHNLTLKAIDCLLIVDEGFTIQDKKEFTNDALALLRFGQWFLAEKFTAFFLNFNQSYKG